MKIKTYITYCVGEKEIKYNVEITNETIFDFLIDKVDKDLMTTFSPDEKSFFRLGFKMAIELLDKWDLLDEDLIVDHEELNQYLKDDCEGEAMMSVKPIRDEIINSSKSGWKRVLKK